MRKKKKDETTYVSQRDKINQKIKIREFHWTDKQKEFIKLAQDKDTRIIICKGPAGTSKTLLAVYVSLLAISEKKSSQIFYTRNPVESSAQTIGFLPGDSNEKLSPYIQPLQDKLLELLEKPEIEKLLKEKRVVGLPIGFLRGLSLNVSSIVCDEAQNLRVQDLLLVATRMGKFSKVFILGDEKQPDIKNSGFSKVFELFRGEESKSRGIHTFEFTKEDIMRDKLLSYIIEKFEIL